VRHSQDNDVVDRSIGADDDDDDDGDDSGDDIIMYRRRMRVCVCECVCMREGGCGHSLSCRIATASSTTTAAELLIRDFACAPSR